MKSNEMEWPDLSGFGLHLKTFYFKDVFGFNNEIIGTINLLIDTLPIIRSDKAKAAGLISLIGQPNHNIYEEVDVDKPETLLMAPSVNPPNLFQIPTNADTIIEPALFVAQLGLPIGRYRKVSTTQAEIDYHFYKHAAPILNRMKLILQAQYPYLKNQSDIKIISGPFGRYLDNDAENISEIDPVEIMQTKGDLKNGMSGEYLSERLISIYQKHPLTPSDITNIVSFSCQAQPSYKTLEIGDQFLLEPIMPVENHKTKLEQMFYFSEFIKGRWVASIQESFLSAVLADDYSIAQIEQQKLSKEHPDRFQSSAMILPQSQDWLLDLCESDKNNPFNDTTNQTVNGSYSTPLFVAYQIARLLSVDGMFEPIDVKKNQKPNLLDMTAGFGSMWSFLSNCSITAFESDSNIYKYLPTVSRMFNYLQDDNEFLPLIDDVVNESVLTTSLSSTAHGDDLGYHYIIATPDFVKTTGSIAFPFIDIEGIYHFEAKSNRLDHHIVALGLQHLKPHGRMVFLLGVDDAGEISAVESFFYQYLHTYYKVDLIVEMSSAIFYGSGYDKNVRLHVVSGKRDMPKDEAEIVARTHSAIKPVMPIAKNNSQLNNLVQHYTANKYQNARFDKLISNSLEGLVKRPLPPSIPAYRLLFTDKHAYLNRSEINADTVFIPLATAKPDNDKVVTLSNGSNVPAPVTATETVEPENEAGTTNDAVPTDTQIVDDAESDSDNTVNGGESNTDPVDESGNDVSSDAVMSVDVSTDTNEGDIDSNEADVDDEADGSHGSNLTDDDDESGNYPAKSTDPDDDDDDDWGIANDEDRVDVDPDDLMDMTGDMTGDIDDDDDDDDDGEYTNEDDDVGLDIEIGGDDSETTDEPTISYTTDDDDFGGGSEGGKDLPPQDSDVDDESTDNGKELPPQDGDIDESADKEEAASVEPDAGKTEIANDDSDVVLTEEGVVFVGNDDDTTETSDVNDGAVDAKDKDEPLVHPDAEPLPPMDAITSLKQGRLASVSIKTPQGLTMVKQPSLTGRSTGSITRLLSSTQLALYQEVPQISNDLFSLTSSIDGWIYKTFNLNFKAAQKIFELLPDFAKHASAYYCSSMPNEHVIFDVSRRSQYYIAALITLFKLKNSVDKQSNRPVFLCYETGVDLIEMINCFEALAVAVNADYEKKKNPVEHLLGLICVLYKLSAGKLAIDVSNLIHIVSLDAALEHIDNQTVEPFLVIVGSDFFDITLQLNETKGHGFDHVLITSHDVFDINLLPNISGEYGANNIYALLPYYLTKDLTSTPRALLKDKRLFFLLYEKCLHRASRVGFIQYNYEPLTYAELPVRVLENPPQEGLHTLIDALHHLSSQMQTVNDMCIKVRNALPNLSDDDDDMKPDWYHKDAALLIDECFSTSKSALRMGAIQDVVSDNYRHGKHSTLPTTLNYNTLIAEYLLYTYHSVDFIRYLSHDDADACQWLLDLTPQDSLQASDDHNLVVRDANGREMTIHDQMHRETYARDFDQESMLAMQSSIPPQAMAGYHCPNIKDVIDFMSKRCSMVAVEQTKGNKHHLVGIDAYVDTFIDDKRFILCDIAALLADANKSAFENRTDVIRKFVSIIPDNNISALPFEWMSYQLGRVGVNCLYVSSNKTKFTIKDVMSGRESIPRLTIEPETTTLFNFANEVYSASNDAVIVNIESSYCPNIGIAPLRYDRFNSKTDHFRQRSLLVTEFLSPKSIKELVFKLSVPSAKLHQSAMVVTDYIDLDIVEVKGYGEMNDVMTVSALKLAGLNVESGFDVTNHGHYLALLDLLEMPQATKVGLFDDKSISMLSHSELFDVLHSQIKHLTQLDGKKQTQLTANLRRYMDIYHVLYPNGWAWYQNLFYVHHDLKALPVYDDKTPGENLYPRQFEYKHTAGFTPTVAMVVATAKEFVLNQYRTIESYVSSMSKDALADYYTEGQNMTFEMFAGLSKSHQHAYIYSSDFKKQNIYSFKRVVFNEFGVNLDRHSNLEQAVEIANNPAITTLYQKIKLVNNRVSKGASFIANAFETSSKGNIDTHTLTDFVVSAKVSHNNLDADAFFYGYNHNASPLRRNDKQLYMIWLGVMLPKIKFNDSPSEQFALIMPKHIQCPVITNQHDKIIFLDYVTLHQRWQALSGSYQLTIKPKTNELAPNPQREFDAEGNKLSEASANAIATKAQLECESFCKAFSGSSDEIDVSAFKFITESSLSNSVQGDEWSLKTGLYDVIRFSNSTNHSFIHIIKKLSNNN